jgi:ubiquinone/menaquinone biosynthesis C-methylase UbiE
MKSLSFNSMAGFYDETRVVDLSSLESSLDFLRERLPPNKFGNIFYPGIGTGRIAIPLAEKGYSITGIDISKDMLSLLKKRLMQMNQPLPIYFQNADVTRLPFDDNTFDTTITVHLFYFIAEWKQAINEILRVTKSECPLILMHTGTGTEVPFLNNRYRELCAENGYSIPEIGVISNRQATDYCESRGLYTEWIRDRWTWMQHIRLDKALDYLRFRAYSFTTFASDTIHLKVVDTLESELQNQFVSLTTEMDIPNQIYFALILRPR